MDILFSIGQETVFHHIFTQNELSQSFHSLILPEGLCHMLMLSCILKLCIFLYHINLN